MILLDPEEHARAMTMLEELRQHEELQNQVKSFGLKYYRPHAKQAAFHNAGAHYIRRAFFAGNRTGKSDCGCAETCAQLLNERVWLPETHEARRGGIAQRPKKLVVLTTDWDIVHKVFTNPEGALLGKLWKFLPPDFVTSKKKTSNGVIYEINTANGSSLTFDVISSYKQNPQGAESADWDGIQVDEPIPEDMWKAYSRGLIDRQGYAFFNLTPLKERWIFDMFFGPAETESMLKQRDIVTLRDKTYWSITGSIYDNPYLSREAIKMYLDTLTEDEKQCRIHGIPLELSGLIYKNFYSHLHLMSNYAMPEGWQDYDTPPAGYPLYLQVDPHPHTPVAGLFGTVDSFGRKYIYDELWYQGSIKDIADAIFTRKRSLSLIRAMGDPCMFNTDKLTSTCWADDFAEHGLFFERAQKDLARGIKAVQSALDARINDIPEWLFSPYLRQFIFEIRRWSWDKDNKPTDKHDHLMECLYRMVLDKPEWVDPKPKPLEDLEELTYIDYESNRKSYGW